jgi:hypothetical protein
MDQFDQFDQSSQSYPLNPPLSGISLPSPPSPPLPSLLPADASDASNALLLPPLATYPSKVALFEAIQSWSKLQGYAFTIIRSKRIRDGRQKVYYACDRSFLSMNIRTERVRNTQSRGTGCLFQVIAAETLSLNWEVRYRPEARFNTHNHPPSQSSAAHPSHCKLPIEAQNTACNLFLAGNN